LDREVIIRPVNENDAKGILEIYSPYILYTPVSFETEVPGLEAYRQRIRQYQERMPWLVCEINRNLAGYAYATDHRQRKAYYCTKELSVYVHKNYQHRGVATGLYTALIDILILQGATNVLAGITLPNPESVGFHENFGFKPVGVYHKVGYKQDIYHDAGWWELEIGDNNKYFSDIIPVAELVDSEGWHLAINKGISKIK
jgi:phosphinothricin acetyltransferase